MNRKILPYYEKPPLLAKNIYPHMLTIAMNNSKIYDWMAESFIQLHVSYEDGKTDVDPIFWLYNDHNSFHSYEYLVSINKICPFLDIYRHPYYECKELGIDIIDFLINKIENEYYIMLQLDCAKINAYNWDREKFIQHSPLLFGFDKNKKEFYFRDFCGLYYETKIALFEEIKEAFNSFLIQDRNIYSVKTNYLFGINCIKLTDNNFTFSLKKMKMYLNDYLNGEHVRKYYNSFIQNDYVYYGLDIINKTICSLENCLSQNIDFFGSSMKYTYMLDHKKAMLMRIDFLKQNNFINEDRYQCIYPLCQNIYKLSQKLQNIQIKLNISREIVLLNKQIDILNEIKQKDIELIENLLSLL